MEEVWASEDRVSDNVPINWNNEHRPILGKYELRIFTNTENYELVIWENDKTQETSILVSFEKADFRFD